MKKNRSGAIELPVLDAGRRKPTSTRGRWRAAVLILVHVIFAIHIAHWLIVGTTLSPVEPSESMQTLELGAINAGFVFFVLAILSTFVFGRFLCGWGCHVVALQDACTWGMNRLGMRPKPFRSRLLVWAPLGFGLYMFVWPTFKRGVVFPLLDALGAERPAWLKEVAPLRGFHSEMMVADFWATFPPWFVAIPFFLVIGFAAVYFLGSKGFCTYGCPYGGIFGVADRFSPGRIKVSDRCEGSGHCTAVCTSNVRVHEEVRDFGMVMDPGCMKCLDCVSACPNDALSFGFASPSVLAKPRSTESAERVRRRSKNPKRFDLTMPEEIAAAAVFVGLFLGFRGFLNHIPMLMAVGIAGVGTFLIWKAWSLVRLPNVRMQRLQLKAGGRWRPAGMAVAAVAGVTAASAAWGGWVNQARWRAHLAHQQVAVPLGVILRPEYEPAPEISALAQHGYALMLGTRSIADGGTGWSLRPRDHREAAFLALVTKDRENAVDHLRSLIRTGVPTDELVQHLGSVLQARGAQREELIEAYADAVQRHPDLAYVRADLARLRVFGGVPPTEALEGWRARLASEEATDQERLIATELFTQFGFAEEARRIYESLGSDRSRTPDEVLLRARIDAGMGARGSAAEALRGLVDNPRAQAAHLRSAIGLLTQLGETDAAERLLDVALESHPGSPALAMLGATRLITTGNAADAAGVIERAVGAEPRDPWELAAIGEQAVRLGLATRHEPAAAYGIGLIELASDRLRGSATLAHDLGMALLAVGRLEEGLDRLRTAVELAPENTAIRAAYERSRADVAGARGS